MIFQVINLRSKEIGPQVEVEATSPDDAARFQTDDDLAGRRSSHHVELDMFRWLDRVTAGISAAGI